MTLGSDVIDRYSGSEPFCYMSDHACGDFCIGCDVEAVKFMLALLMNEESWWIFTYNHVQLGVGISGPSSVEGNRNKILSEHGGPYITSQGAILVEYLIDDILEL